MRLAYLESERGNTLIFDDNTNPQTYTVIRTVDSVVLFGPGYSQVQVEAHCAGIDPSIVLVG